ncbi:MAG: peptidase, partial [Sphingomonadales bacterium]|nr:peptidase [Sphingomonadales bacterium]
MPNVLIPPHTAGRDGARRFNLPLGARALTVGSYDAERRTVELIAATETRVRASGWDLGLDCEWYWEVLDCRAESVDLSEVEAGNVPLLDAHARWSVRDQLGRIQSARTEGGQVIALAAFGQSAAARAVEAEVAAGTAPKISAGFKRVEMRWEGTDEDIPIYRVTKWALREASFVPIAADPNAGVRSADHVHPCTIIKEPAMPQTEIPDASAPGNDANTDTVTVNAGNDGQRAAPPPPSPRVIRFTAGAALALVEDARAFGDTVVTRARELIDQNERGEITVDGARAALSTAMAEAQRLAVRGVPTGGRGIEITADDRDKFVTGAVNSIIHRAG